MSKTIGALLAALALTVIVVAPAGAATSAGGIGLRLLDVPTDSSDDPRAQLYIIDHVAPGGTIKRRIEIVNTAAATAHVALYPSAATITKGSFLGAEGNTPNELSNWTSVDPVATGLSPNGRTTGEVTIRVPADASEAERYAVVWAEVRSAPDDDGITQVSRVGIRIYLSVGPGGEPAAGFTIDSLSPHRSDDGRPVIIANVHNTGGRALDIAGTLELSDGPGGLSAGPFPATLGTTLGIGETEEVEIVLDKSVPAGPWNARIELKSGLLEHSARATVTFPAAGTAPPVTVETGRGWLWILIGGAILLLLVVIVGLLLRTRRRRHTQPAYA